MGVEMWGLMHHQINAFLMYYSQCVAGHDRERCGCCCRWRVPRSARIWGEPVMRPGHPAWLVPKHVTDQQSYPVGSSPWLPASQYVLCYNIYSIFEKRTSHTFPNCERPPMCGYFPGSSTLQQSALKKVLHKNGFLSVPLIVKFKYSS